MHNHNIVPAFLTSAQRFGVDLSLDRMVELMSRLNNPQNDCNIIHVAGTNGKGSVVAFISTILACADNKVGVYTSPYIERFTERVRILDGKQAPDQFLSDSSHGEISIDDLYYFSDVVKNVVDEMVEDGFEHPTEFELVTALSFLYFADCGCDYIVLETGLGGRFDATNVVARPLGVVISAIGFDHMDCLGYSIDKIAFEKAGIIKDGCPVFLSDLSICGLSDDDAQSARRVIREVCLERNAPFYELTGKEVSITHHDINGQIFELSDSIAPIPLRFHTLMHGGHQVINAALAVFALKEWVSIENIYLGVSKAFWKARNEVVSKQPLIILDGAHNPQSMACFRDTSQILLSINQATRFRLIVGMLKDKDIYASVEIMLDQLLFEIEDILCVTPDHPRAVSADDLATLIRQVIKRKMKFYKQSLSMYNVQSIVRISKNTMDDCLDIFNQSRKDNIPILCTGSLYLAGQIRSIFIHNKETQR